MKQLTEEKTGLSEFKPSVGTYNLPLQSCSCVIPTSWIMAPLHAFRTTTNSQEVMSRLMQIIHRMTFGELIINQC